VALGWLGPRGCWLWPADSARSAEKKIKRAESAWLSRPPTAVSSLSFFYLLAFKNI
jgi:hypothetical protein